MRKYATLSNDLMPVYLLPFCVFVYVYVLLTLRRDYVIQFDH